MGKIKLASYKELHPEMKQYIVSHLFIAGGMVILGAIVAIVVGLVTPFLVGMLVGAAYALYYVGILISCLLGRGDVYEGVVVKTSGDIKGGKVKAARDFVTNKPMRPVITIRTLVDQKLLEIPLHQKNRFEKGNKITLFTPSNVIYQRAEDSFYCSGYYKIKLDTVVYGEIPEDDEDEAEEGRSRD